MSGKQVQLHKRSSNHKKRDLVFDNSLLLKILLKEETDLMQGLKIEYDYIKNNYENNI